MDNIKILYVEDEPFLAKIVRESLESRGFNVCLIEDGGEALNAYQTFQPQICVLDVMLPNKDGFEIAKEIREVNEKIPIIFLTAKDQVPDLIQGFKSGGNDYIKKPFSMEELILRIKNMIQIFGQIPISEETDQRIEMGTFFFNPKKYELQFGEEITKLSYKEVQLLTILNDNRNEVTERKDILLKIWNDDSFFNSRNLDVYIRKLRTHFAKDSQVQIITLKGVGYNFVVE